MIEIIFGPPGTGKTTELIRLVEQELNRGVAPDRIGYLTFTKRGAEEAVTRACDRFKLDRKALPYFSTLHSLCFRQLGLRRSDVLQGKPMRDFAEYAGVPIYGDWMDEDGVLQTRYEVGDRILFMENLARIRRVPLRQAYDQNDDGLRWTEVYRVSKALEKYKDQSGLMDFTDMLTEFVKKEIDLRLEVLIVDEAQDLSRIQWDVVNLLARGCRRVVIAGDDDQAIYRWAGADVSHLIGMGGSVRVLDQSWRVPLAIQNLANSIISNVRHRRDKSWTAKPGVMGSIARVGSFVDADCNVGETLILTRNAYVIHNQVKPELRRQGIIYELNGEISIDHSILDVIQNWESLRAGRAVLVSATRKIYEQMKADVGYVRGFKTLPGRPDDEQVTLEELQASGGLLVNSIWHEALTRLPSDEVNYLLAALRRGESTKRPRVRVSTIHGSKGGEADHVVLLKEMAKRTYNEMYDNDEDEARVWYVAVTRAKEKLTVIESSTRRECPWV